MSFVNTVDLIGDETLAAIIIERSITEIADSFFKSIGKQTFRYCTALKSADFPAVTSIMHCAFENCSSLKALILRNTSKCTLADSNAFTSTPIASGTGYIYVPRALVDSYKTASYWKTYANQFRALEDYTVDGTITGELDESKI
jgi:hypothetical protein